MAEDKRTKIGATGPYIPQPAAPTPVPSTQQDVASPQAPTTFLPPGTPPPQSTPMPAVDPSKSYIPGPPQGDPLLGQTLAGRYLIAKKLGEGGMGAVYLATHLLLEKQVALKVLHNEFARKADLVERFMQEAKSASRIRHENVIDISDFGTTPEGLVFFAMELLQGHDLHEEIARARMAGQLLPWSRSKKIFLQICSALAAAHGKGIVHRDLKPENVYLVDFLGEADFVKLLDFGIAKLTEVNEEGRKLTRTGMLFGTPEYMSPEQARGEHVDHRVDVYAMGCILFQLVTGRVPFEADNFMGVLSLHLTEPPPEIPPAVFERIGAPAQLAVVIDTALAKDKTQRWQTIDDLANAVRIACGDAPLDPARATAGMTAQRAASVPAPEVTKQARTPTPPPDARQRTQWTGNLSVPEAPPDAPQPRSKLPLIIAGIVIAGAAAAAVFFATRPSDKGGDPGVTTPSNGTPSGSQIAQQPPPPVDAPPAVVLPDPPKYSELTIETVPPGAVVTDLSSTTTPKFSFKSPGTVKVAGSHAPRTFSFKLRGFKDSVVEIVPNEAKVKYVETMVKGSGTVVRDAGSAKPPEVKPPDGSNGSATVITPPDPPKIDAGVPPVNEGKKKHGEACAVNHECERPLTCLEGKCDFGQMVVPE